MDMKILGSGKIASGEYEKIAISGSGKLSGLVRCTGFYVSGSASGESLECADECKIAGSCKFSRDVKAKTLVISGSLSCGDINAENEVRVAGSAKCEGSLKCASLTIAGTVSVSGDAEAETVKLDGVLNCAGLLNAEEISIKFEKNMTIGSIGGSKIVILRKNPAKQTARLPLFSSLSNWEGNVLVKNAIEGDEIALENVIAESVSGRIVAIGDGCEIGLVQYSDRFEISPNAKVGRIEHLGEEKI
ncbi:MAG: polymer-forming cytoskeletal protein [Clostridia bacterium]|nr:polymer-forming cytoskeletal protein [Clostridia bacterium]